MFESSYYSKVSLNDTIMADKTYCEIIKVLEIRIRLYKDYGPIAVRHLKFETEVLMYRGQLIVCQNFPLFLL